MPQIKDKIVIEGRKNRNSSIRDYFNRRWTDGARYDVIEAEVKAKWGLGASSINRILKEK
jgi:hypothetical protein